MNLKEHYKQRLNEARGEPDTRELDRQLGLLDTAFIAGYPRGEMHRAEVARAERVRGAINPHRPGSIEMAMARGLLPAVPAELARSFLALNKDQAAELEEPSRSKSKGDPRHVRSYINTLRKNSEFYRDLPTFPTRSNPLGTVPGYLANNQALAGHRRQSAAAWRYSPTGETEYYDPTRHPHNPRNLSQAAVDIARLRRGDLLGNVSREDLEKIFRLRQDHKAQRRSGGPRTGGKSLSEHRLDEGVVGKVMKKLKRTGQLLKAVFTQNLSPGMRLQINRDIRAKEQQQGGTGMNLKEHYKKRMLEDLQTPERAEEMDAAERQAKRRAGTARPGMDALLTGEIAKRVAAQNRKERRDPKLVYGKGGRVVGKVVPTRGSAARTR